MFLKPKENDTNNEMKIVDNLRGLSIDMIHEAGSGHPGISLDSAPILYTLYAKHLKINPSDPNWINRDRFILSAGHASSLLYATLYMSGFDLSLDDLKKFRTLHSKTPGHPEYMVTPGVDMSTGPLGEGISSAVGMAMGECFLREYYRKQNLNIFDYYTYVLCSDGDLLEGVSYEAMALAGTLKLNKLIVLYDSNKICLDGKVEDVNSVDMPKYFSSLNWNVLMADGEDINSIDNAITRAKQGLLPTIIIVNTTIGKHSKYEGTNYIHGSKLSKEDITEIKNELGLRDIPFTVSNDSKEEMENMILSRNKEIYDKWQKDYELLDISIKNALEKIKNHDLSLDDINFDYIYSEEESESLRSISSKILNLLADSNPMLLGGSADLSTTIQTKIDNGSIFSKDNYLGRNICYGVREHAMASIMNGLSLTGIRNFSSTFLAFSDYCKPAIRLACQMNLANVYLFSHDSITVGQDGPTHQPVEQLVSLRSMPNLEVLRPADVNEMIGIYKYVFSKKEGPSAIILSRNSTKTKENTSINEVKKGAYIVSKEEKELDAIIVSSGEELDLALDVSKELSEKGYGIRVVSMPSISLFQKQKSSYQEEIIPTNTKVFVIEASSSYSWYFLVNSKDYLFTVDEYGKSGTKEDLMKEYGFTSDKISSRIQNLLK